MHIVLVAAYNALPIVGAALRDTCCRQWQGRPCGKIFLLIGGILTYLFKAIVVIEVALLPKPLNRI